MSDRPSTSGMPLDVVVHLDGGSWDGARSYPVIPAIFDQWDADAPPKKVTVEWARDVVDIYLILDTPGGNRRRVVRNVGKQPHPEMGEQPTPASTKQWPEKWIVTTEWRKAAVGEFFLREEGHGPWFAQAIIETASEANVVVEIAKA